MGLILKIKILVVAMETYRQFAYPASEFCPTKGFVNIYPKLQKYIGVTKSRFGVGFSLLALGLTISKYM